jgi:biotin carboxylase
VSPPRLLVAGLGAGMDRSLAPIAALGVELVVLTAVPTVRVRRATARVIAADPADAEDAAAALALAGVRAVDGVMSLGFDNPPVVARLCARFGCRGLDEEVALDCTWKDRRLRILARHGLGVPRHAAADGEEEALAALATVGLPAVVKPVDGTSSIAVAKVASMEGAAAAVRTALAVSRVGRVVVEEFLEGTEHTVTGFSVDGRVVVTGFSDRDYRRKEAFPPHFFEAGDTVPTALDPEMAGRVEAEVARGVRALQLDPAFFNTDVLVTEDGRVVLLEVTGRLTGARIATEVVPLVTGVDPLPDAVRLALGRPLALSPPRPPLGRASVQRYRPCTGGVVEWVGELASIPRPPGLYDVEWGVQPRPGARLPRYRSGEDVLAGAIAFADTVPEAEVLAEAALAALPLRVAGG